MNFWETAAKAINKVAGEEAEQYTWAGLTYHFATTLLAENNKGAVSHVHSKTFLLDYIAPCRKVRVLPKMAIEYTKNGALLSELIQPDNWLVVTACDYGNDEYGNDEWDQDYNKWKPGIINTLLPGEELIIPSYQHFGFIFVPAGHRIYYKGDYVPKQDYWREVAQTIASQESNVVIRTETVVGDVYVFGVDFNDHHGRNLMPLVLRELNVWGHLFEAIQKGGN